MPWVCDDTSNSFGEFTKKIKEFREDYYVPEAEKFFKGIEAASRFLFKFVTVKDSGSIAELNVAFSQRQNALSIQLSFAIGTITKALMERKADASVMNKFILKQLYLVDVFRKFTEGCSKIDITLATYFTTQIDQIKRETMQRVKDTLEEMKKEALGSKEGSKQKIDLASTTTISPSNATSEVPESVNESKTDKLQTPYFIVNKVAGDLESKSTTEIAISNVPSAIQASVNEPKTTQGKEANATDELQLLLNRFESKLFKKMKEMVESNEANSTKSSQKKLTGTYTEEILINNIDQLQIKDKGKVIIELEEELAAELEGTSKQQLTSTSMTQDTNIADQKKQVKSEEIGEEVEQEVDNDIVTQEPSVASRPSFFKHAFQYCTKTMSSGVSTITLGAGYLGLTYLSKNYGEMMDQMIHADETGVTHQMVIAGTLVLMGVGMVSTGLGRSYSSFPRSAKKSEDRNIEAAPEEKISLIGNEDSSTMPANAPERSRYSSMY